MKKQLIFLLFAAFAGFSVQAQDIWTIDKAHSNIRFTVTHYVVSEVDGDFKEFDGSITEAGNDFVGAQVTFVAKAASINTSNEGRDKHLKGDDFFSVETYPDIKFGGNIIKENGKYYLVGDFTIRDVTKPIKFDVKYNGKLATSRGAKAGFKVSGSINRFDYGLKWSRLLEAGGLSVGEEVQINCNIELNEKMPEAAK